MSRRLLLRTCVLLAVTGHVRAQYIDFFQSFNSFLQPFSTVKPGNDVTKRPSTKHRLTNKQKYQDAIFFDDDTKQTDNGRTLDPFNIYSTTRKPRRKSKTTTAGLSSNDYTTRSSKPKTVNSNKIISNVNHEVTRSVNNNREYNSNVDNKATSNARRIDNIYNNQYTNSETMSNKATNNIFGYQDNNYNTNRQTTQRTTDYYNNDRQTTRRTTTDYYNNQRQTTHNYRQTTNLYDERTTRRSNNRPYGSQTTSNPLLNRPGVIPAVVNESKPPITNRPVTERPVYDRPFDTGTFRPVNTRPPYEIERTTKRPVETRPANTRPPYEIERPVSGIHRPITSGSKPDRPVTSGVKPVESNVDEEPDVEIGPDEDEMSESEKRRLYDICEQKCDEYKSARVKKVVALPLAPQSQGVEVNVTSCAPNDIPLIIGGKVVRIQQFPHMALVGWKKIQSSGYAWKCGGSLISEQYILTAGHCTYHDKDYNVISGPPHAVQLGSAVYNDRTATVVQVTTVIRHPKYKLRRSYHDVALIKLHTTVSFSDRISPACLGVPPSVGEPVIATGWGKTEFGGDSSIELRSVSIPIWDMAECRDIWGTSLKLPQGPAPDSQVCAGDRNGAKDTCQGDSGGPAQVQDGCAWRVVAVTSVGRSCGAPDTPALYATVPRAFIAKQVYTNVKSGRDGNDQYGNAGTNNNGGNSNNNNDNGNNNNGNNNEFGNQEINRPIENNGNYDYRGRVPIDNGQYYSGSQNTGNVNSQITDNNWNINANNYVSNQQTTNNKENNNNGYVQNTGYNQNRQTTSTVGYNQNNYGQNSNQNNYGQGGYNNEQNQNRRNTEYPSDIRNYGTQNSGYNDNGYTDNGYNSYGVVNRPWRNR